MVCETDGCRNLLSDPFLPLLLHLFDHFFSLLVSLPLSSLLCLPTSLPVSPLSLPVSPLLSFFLSPSSHPFYFSPSSLLSFFFLPPPCSPFFFLSLLPALLFFFSPVSLLTSFLSRLPAHLFFVPSPCSPLFCPVSVLHFFFVPSPSSLSFFVPSPSSLSLFVPSPSSLSFFGLPLPFLFFGLPLPFLLSASLLFLSLPFFVLPFFCPSLFTFVKDTPVEVCMCACFWTHRCVFGTSFYDVLCAESLYKKRTDKSKRDCGKTTHCHYVHFGLISWIDCTKQSFMHTRSHVHFSFLSFLTPITSLLPNRCPSHAPALKWARAACSMVPSKCGFTELL